MIYLFLNYKSMLKLDYGHLKNGEVWNNAEF